MKKFEKRGEASLTDNGRQFEPAMRELEDIVAQLEAGGLALDESMRLFEQGTVLFTQCNQMLDDAQLRMDVLFDEAGLTKTRRLDFSQMDDDEQDGYDAGNESEEEI